MLERALQKEYKIEFEEADDISRLYVYNNIIIEKHDGLYEYTDKGMRFAKFYLEENKSNPK